MPEWDDKTLRQLLHPIRRRVIDCLREKNSLSYSEILKHVEASNHGKLGFHMRALEGLIEREPLTNKYHLTDKGYLASELIWDISFIMSRGGRDLAHEPSRYVRRLSFGDHAFLLYDRQETKREIVFSFLESGLPKNEAIVYLVSENKLDQASREIQRYGIGADYFRNKAFTIMSAEEWYIRKGKAEAKKIIDNWLRLLRVKQREGFTGLKVATEMETFLRISKSTKLLEYERMLGKKFSFDICGLCIYDTESVDEHQIHQLSKCHGHMISKDIAWKI